MTTRRGRDGRMPTGGYCVDGIYATDYTEPSQRLLAGMWLGR